MVDKTELREQILFRELSEAELAVVAQKIVEEHFRPGQSIFSEGDRTAGIYLIKSGKVEISKTTLDGWKHQLAVLSENSIFGELSVIENKKTHGADAIAMEPTELCRIAVGDFKAFEKTNADMMYKMMKTLTRVASIHVHAMNDKVMRQLVSY